jgi:hypothetical protein
MPSRFSAKSAFVKKSWKASIFPAMVLLSPLNDHLKACIPAFFSSLVFRAKRPKQCKNATIGKVSVKLPF